MTNRYSFFLCTSILILLSVTFLINYIVNPYGIFDNNRFPIKNHIYSERMTKFYYASRSEFDNILIGSSRIGVFNPQKLKPYLSHKTYNMSLDGASIFEEYSYIEYFTRTKNIDTIILGLDFFSFNSTLLEKDDFSLERLDNSVYLNDYIKSLLSYQALKSSFNTISDNYYGAIKKQNFITGHKTYENQEKNKNNLKMIQSNINITLKQYKLDPRQGYTSSLKDNVSIKKLLNYVEKIVKLQKMRKFDLKIYISPIHEKHIDLIYELGFGSHFEFWKTELSKITDYYDFSNKNYITKNIENFWDSSHIQEKSVTILFKEMDEENSIFYRKRI